MQTFMIAIMDLDGHKRLQLVLADRAEVPKIATDLMTPGDAYVFWYPIRVTLPAWMRNQLEAHI